MVDPGGVGALHRQHQARGFRRCAATGEGEDRERQEEEGRSAHFSRSVMYELGVTLLLVIVPRAPT